MGRPLGPNGTWKTGQRVPFTGFWCDQYGQVNFFEKHSTFPPVVAHDGGPVAYRTFIKAAATA